MVDKLQKMLANYEQKHGLVSMVKSEVIGCTVRCAGTCAGSCYTICANSAHNR